MPRLDVGAPGLMLPMNDRFVRRATIGLVRIFGLLCDPMPMLTVTA